MLTCGTASYRIRDAPGKCFKGPPGELLLADGLNVEQRRDNCTGTLFWSHQELVTPCPSRYIVYSVMPCRQKQQQRCSCCLAS